MRTAWDWRARVAELRRADGVEEATNRSYGAATKRLQADLPQIARKMTTQQISDEYGVSRAYVHRVLRTARAAGKIDAPRYVRK